MKFGEQTTNEMAFAFVQVTLDSPALVPEFRRDANAEFVASLLDGDLNSDEFGPQETARLKMLLNFFDKNKNGRIDPEERLALIEFLKKREAAR